MTWQFMDLILRLFLGCVGNPSPKQRLIFLRANIADPYLGMTHYYAYGKDLLYSEIIIPDYAPRDYLDLTTLLSAIENAEKKV